MKTFPIFTHFLVKFLPALAALVLFGCTLPESSSAAAAKTPGQILREVQARNIASLYTHDKGDAITPNANIVLASPGGPEFRPPTFGNRIKNNKFVRIMVKQEQMIRRANRTFPMDRVMSEQEANEINLYSAAILYAVAKDFKAKGHKVSLYSRSFGSFIVPKMLQHYGDEPFEKLFIVVGRLDMQLEAVNGFASGEPKIFKNGTQVSFGSSIKTAIQQLETICKRANAPNVTDQALIQEAKSACTGGELNNELKTAFNLQRNAFILQSSISRNRYTQLLKGKDLSKIVYYFGGIDPNVGRLTNREVRFLTGRTGFDVATPSGPGHTETPFTQGTESRKMHTITGASDKHATVKYDLQAGHRPLKVQATSDIAASFP